MPYMPGTGYLTGFKQKTFQAGVQPTLIVSEPKVSTLVGLASPTFGEVGELGTGVSSPLIVAQPVQVLEAASPHLTVVRGVLGLGAKVPIVKSLVKKVFPRAFEVGASVPTKEVVKTVTGGAVTALTAKEVVDVIGPTVADLTAQAIQIGVKVYDELSELGPLGGNGVSHPQAGTSIAIRPSGPVGMGIMPGGDQIVKTWHANGIPFWRTMDGWIYVQRKDGTVKRYRPYKSVVLGKRPSSKQVNRAINKLKREDKIYSKLNKLFHRTARRSSK
jgi:hypothetical protein